MNPEIIDKAQSLSLEIAGMLTLMKHNIGPDNSNLLLSKVDSLRSMLKPAGPAGPVEQPQEATEELPEEVEEAAVPVEMPATVGLGVTAPMAQPQSDPEPDSEPKPAAPRRDLRKSLTINDRYLFCRELFDMSNNVLNRTLETVGGMETFDEARDYVLNTLELEADNPATDYFLSFISRHFK